MQLSQLTVLLEMAKQLKEAGYPQESLFKWIPKYVGNTSPSGEDIVTYVLQQDTMGIAHWGTDEQQWFAAPTASELGEQLPWGTKSGKILYRQRGKISVEKPPEKWNCHYFGYAVETDMHKVDHSEQGITEADARAKMWLYLKQHQLLQGE